MHPRRDTLDTVRTVHDWNKKVSYSSESAAMSASASSASRSRSPAPPPPAPAAQVQADSLFRAAERIDSQNIGREQYNAPRPVMNPVRSPIDNDLLNDLDIGTPQQPSKAGIDTSFLDDLL